MILTNTLLYVCLAIWFIVAIVSLVIEIETFQLVSVWFVVGAIGAMITTAIAPKDKWGVVWQLVIFILVSVITLLAVRPLCRKRLKVDPEANKDINSMIGLTGIALSDIDSKSGQVRINDTTWSAQASLEIKEGTRIRIVKQDNLTLIVEEEK